MRHYIALGDSVSLDLYPALDAGEIDVAVALERVASAGRVAPIGAASLLYRNDDARWPDDVGKDLSSHMPDLVFENLASDGATLGEVFGEQIPQLTEHDGPTLVTLTIGAYDLLSASSSRPRRSVRERIGADLAEAYDLLVDLLRARVPQLTLVVSTVYDPSDRTGRIPDVHDGGPLPLHLLDGFNAHVRALAAGTPGVLLAEVYGHFLGHGVTAPEADRWYWRRSFTEPNARGASEIRRLWFDALQSAGAIG